MAKSSKPKSKANAKSKNVKSKKNVNIKRQKHTEKVSKKKSNKIKKMKSKNKGFSTFKLKSATKDDLISELKNVEKIQRKNPASQVKNKDMRKRLVLLRSMKRNLIKGKIRRKNQTEREETGDETKPLIKTIENQRDFDETIGNNDDPDLIEELKNDEFSDIYNNKDYEPQIMLTTAVKYTSSIFKFIKELTDAIPNCHFFYRKKFTLKEIIGFAKERNFTDVIVVSERLRQPYRLIISHLNDGPTVEFKISNIYYHDEIEHKAKVTSHYPEILFKNFSTKVGQRAQRIIGSIFPQRPDLNGRRVITFHNQRDCIFFRHHRYIFTEDFQKVKLQEIGPRFTLRLQSIQKGTFDSEFGEFEWLYKDSMGVRRRKLNL